MVNEDRIKAYMELFDDTFCESSSMLDSIENSLYMVESDLSDLLTEYYDDSGQLYEEKSLKDVVNKSKGAIGRLMGSAKKLVDWLDSKAFTSLANKIQDAKIRDQSIRIDQDLSKTRKNVYKAMDWITEHLKKFQKVNGYGKLVIPVSSVLSWVPPFTPIPGSEAMMISVSSAGDFLLDFKRRYKGQDYNAINQFNLWVSANMDKLSESDVYACDKFIQKVANTVSSISTTIKKICLEVNRALYKVAEVGGKAVADRAKSGSKTERIATKISKTGKSLGKDAKNTLTNLQGYNKEKRFVKKGKEAVMKARNEGYKSLSKKEFQTAQKFKEQYGSL